MGTIQKYILVDDDPINNLISSRAIQKVVGKAEVKIFSVPEEGLAFIQNAQAEELRPTILFLDINMPTMSGWEFMKEFAKLSDDLKGSIDVYIVSSSVSQIDRDESDSNKYIKGFLTKPLKMETVLKVSTIQKFEILEDGVQ